MRPNYSPSNKENYPLQNKSPRKYTYTKSFMNEQKNPQKCEKDPYEYIAQLQYQLQKQRERCKQIQQTTIRQQMNVLEQVSFLEERFAKVSKQKQILEQELEHLSSNNILSEYKKIKGIETALIGMMEKVDGRDGDIKDAWKWNKKIVWEYQAIKKKALKWKQVFDKCKCKNRTNTFEEASISSDSSFDY